MSTYADLSRSPTIVDLQSPNLSGILSAQRTTESPRTKPSSVVGLPSVDGSTMSVSNGYTGASATQSKNFKAHALEPIDKSRTNWLLMVLFFTSGLIDSVAFNSWSCFVSMQTGNTIFAALGLTRQPVHSHPAQYLKSMMSIGSFCVGSFFFAALHRRPFPSVIIRPKSPPPSLRRLILVSSFLIQVIFVIIAAALVTAGVVSNQAFRAGQFSSGSHQLNDGSYDNITTGLLNWADLAPIALLAFQASGQASLSRVLGINELPTIVLSTVYYDFMAEITEILSHNEEIPMWKKFRNELLWNEKRNRRFGAIASLFLGGLVGGYIFRSPVGMCGALWLAAGLKLGIVIAWLFWPGDSTLPDYEQV